MASPAVGARAASPLLRRSRLIVRLTCAHSSSRRCRSGSTASARARADAAGAARAISRAGCLLRRQQAAHRTAALGAGAAFFEPLIDPSLQTNSARPRSGTRRPCRPNTGSWLQRRMPRAIHRGACGSAWCWRCPGWWRSASSSPGACRHAPTRRVCLLPQASARRAANVEAYLPHGDPDHEKHHPLALRRAADRDHRLEGLRHSLTTRNPRHVRSPVPPHGASVRRSSVPQGALFLCAGPCLSGFRGEAAARLRAAIAPRCGARGRANFAVRRNARWPARAARARCSTAT